MRTIAFVVVGVIAGLIFHDTIMEGMSQVRNWIYVLGS